MNAYSLPFNATDTEVLFEYLVFKTSISSLTFLSTIFSITLSKESLTGLIWQLKGLKISFFRFDLLISFTRLKVMPFIKSDLAENIYYADLFQIGKYTWMIMGWGKSDAARIASRKDSNCDYSRDCVAISAINSELFGRFDPGAINTDIDQSLFTQRKIDIVAYCLSPKQTQEIYIEPRNDLEIIEINNELMSTLSIIYPWPAWAASDRLYSNEELAYLHDPERRMNKFKSVTDEVRNAKFVILPFMNTIEEKAALYTNYSATR